MRRTSWLSSLLMVTLVSVAVAADKPDKDKTPRTSPPRPAAKANPKAPKGASAKAAPNAQPTAKPASDPRATSLFRSAQNLEKTGKNPGAIGLYRDVMIKYPDSPEAREAEGRIKALGGKVPVASEIHPASPPEEAKFVRAPKPKYASQEANRAALNEAIGGAVSQPAPGGGYGTQGGYR